MIHLNEYDLLLLAIENIIKENIKCEDNELYLSNKLKYQLFNLIYEIDKGFIEKLFKKIEYKENDVSE